MYRVTLGNALVECETAAEVRELVGAPPRLLRADTAADRALLARFVGAGPCGVPTSRICELLGVQGRGVPKGLVEWAGRVGLGQVRTVSRVLERLRVGRSERRYRLTPAAAQLAPALLDELEK